MAHQRHLLHVFSTFALGGAQARSVAIANALGPEFAHTIAAMDRNFDAAERLDRGLSVALVHPPADNRSLFCSIHMRRAIRQIRPDLVLTYNWGTIDAVLGARLAARPVIHSEDGFGADESIRLKRRRVLARRFLLNGIYTTVVPSRTLLRIALNRYRLGVERVQLIPNGVDVRRFQPRRCAATRRLLGADDSTLLIGYVGLLRPEKNLELLIRSFSAAGLEKARLVLVGDGESQPVLTTLVAQLGLTKQVTFTGSTETPEKYLAAFDLFAMSSRTEQAPLALLEAMACGLPAICTDAGDSGDMLGTREPPVIVPIGDVAAYTKALLTMTSNASLRRHLGTANRNRCVSCYSLEKMISAYSALYEAALGRGLRPSADHVNDGLGIPVP